MFHRLIETAKRNGQVICTWSALLFVGLYIASAELGHLLSFCDYFPTIWPPAGVLLAALLISDTRQWAPILLLAGCAELISHIGWLQFNPTVGLVNFLITSLEAMIGAWILQRCIARPFTGETLREVLGMSILGTLLPTGICSLLGEWLLSQKIIGGDDQFTWGLLWNSHLLGEILAAPAILAVIAKFRQGALARFSWKSAIEAGLAFFLLNAFARMVYSADIQPFAFLVFPVLIWVALRFEIWGSCVGNFIRIYICTCSTRLGYGPFAGDYPAIEQAVILNSFLNITCTTALFLAAVISERRRASRQLQQSELRYRDLLENIGDLVHSVNADGTILYTNRAWRETLGYNLADTHSLSMFDIVHPGDLVQYRNKLTRVLTGQSSERYEIRLITKDGRTIVVEGTSNCRVVHGQPNATRSICRDITGRREHEAQLDSYHRKLEAANRQLQHLAKTDSLTGLNNRRAFHERLHEELERAERHSQNLSLLMLDIDHFKQINDVFGHPAGDKVLQYVAQVLRENAREYDFSARFGGEEFAVILPKTDEENAIVIAERLRTRISTIPFPGRLITVSIGTATLAADEPERDEAALVKSADLALYYSKRHGRNRVTQSTPLVKQTTEMEYSHPEIDSCDVQFANW